MHSSTHNHGLPDLVRRWSDRASEVLTTSWLAEALIIGAVLASIAMLS